MSFENINRARREARTAQTTEGSGRCTAPCTPPCPYPVLMTGLCSCHYWRRHGGYRIDVPADAPAIRSAAVLTSSQVRRRAIDDAVAWLIDPYCIYTPTQAWRRACAARGIPACVIPAEVLEAPSHRPSLGAVAKAIAVARPGAGLERDREVMP